MLAIERHDFILEKLKETGRVQVADLSATLKVSRMTIHRDLDALAKEGLIEKVFGGAVLRSEITRKNQTGVCAVCDRPVSVHTRVVLHLEDGGQLEACCPHCALLLLDSRDDIVSGLAVDFIHGKMINLKTASFLVNPDVAVCCTPPVLCFADASEARRFQLGFNGQVASLRDAQKLTTQHMKLSL
jgi:DNA-binding transcriptional ArsR family regulator